MDEVYRNNGEDAYIALNLVDSANRPHYISSPSFTAGDVTLLSPTGGGSYSSTDIYTQVTVVNSINVLLHLTSSQILNETPQYPILVQFKDNSNAWDEKTIAVWVKELPANLMCINQVPNASAELTIKNLHIQATDGDAFTLYSQEGSCVVMHGNKSAMTLRSDSNGIDIDALDCGVSITSVSDGIRSKEFKLLEAMIKGRIMKDTPLTGDVTIYDRDNSTPLAVMHVTPTERSRLQG